MGKVLFRYLWVIEPTKGKIYVDNICITGKSENNLTKSWRYLIAHAQDIYLSDTTVFNNIAFGIENNQINFDKVRLSAGKQNQILESKSQSFSSIVGEEEFLKRPDTKNCNSESFI